MTTTANLSSRALLVSLNISAWTARKLDRRETLEVTTRNSCHERAARVNKSLLPGSDALESITKKSGEIRKFYYDNTLPWSGDNMHIVKTDAYMEFVQQLRVHMDAWWRLVDSFVLEYPQLVMEAQLRLGKLYEPNDYPHPSDIRDRFNIDVRFAPVPDAGDWRIEVTDEAMTELREHVRKEVLRSQSIAMREAWSRLFDVVKHAHERLSNPENVFRDSLIANARQLCAVLPKLNITDDPELERMRQEVEGALCQHDPETLRNVPDVRARTAARMQQIMSVMAPMYQEAA